MNNKESLRKFQGYSVYLWGRTRDKDQTNPSLYNTWHQTSSGPHLSHSSQAHHSLVTALVQSPWTHLAVSEPRLLHVPFPLPPFVFSLVYPVDSFVKAQVSSSTSVSLPRQLTPLPQYWSTPCSLIDFLCTCVLRPQLFVEIAVCTVGTQYSDFTE